MNVTKMNATKWILMTALVTAVPMLAAGHFDDQARADFFAGFAGNEQALERGMAAAEEVIASEPKMAAEAMAWHGGGLLAQSGRAFNQGDVARGAELWANAVNEMDEAGKREPDNPAVLIPRASVWFVTSRLAPPDMGEPLLKKALADYEHVYDLQKAYFDKLNIHMKSELLFGLADGWSRAGDQTKARAYFEKLAALGAESGHKEQADHYLAGERYDVKGLGCAGCHTSN